MGLHSLRNNIIVSHHSPALSSTDTWLSEGEKWPKAKWFLRGQPFNLKCYSFNIIWSLPLCQTSPCPDYLKQMLNMRITQRTKMKCCNFAAHFHSRHPSPTDQCTPRPLQEQPQGSCKSPRPADARGSPKSAPEVPRQNQPGVLPRVDQEARTPQVTISTWRSQGVFSLAADRQWADGTCKASGFRLLPGCADKNQPLPGFGLG